MLPHSAPNRQRIVLLRATLKLLFLALLAALAVVMARAFLPKPSAPPEPLRVPVASLGVGAVQGVEWNRRRLLVVHVAEGGHYLVIADYDPIYGCPMSWIPPGSHEAPQQPWPGGLRAICTDHWFDAEGRSLTAGVADLQRLPYTLQGTGTLVLSAEAK